MKRLQYYTLQDCQKCFLEKNLKVQFNSLCLISCASREGVTYHSNETECHKRLQEFRKPHYVVLQAEGVTYCFNETEWHNHYKNTKNHMVRLTQSNKSDTYLDKIIKILLIFLVKSNPFLRVVSILAWEGFLSAGLCSKKTS